MGFLERLKTTLGRPFGLRGSELPAPTLGGGVVVSEQPDSVWMMDQASAVTVSKYGPAPPVATLDSWVVDMMRCDDSIKLGLRARRAMYHNARYFIAAGGDPDIRHFLEAALLPMVPEFLSSFALAEAYGWMPHEVMWAVHQGELGGLLDPYVIEALADMRPDSGTNPIVDRGRLVAVERHGKRLPVARTVVVTNEMENGRWRGRSELQAAHIHWWRGNLWLTYFDRYFSRKGDPPLKGTAPPGETKLPGGSSVRNLAALVSLMRNLKGSGAIALPYVPREGSSENQWDVEEMEVSDRAQEFLPALQYLDARKFRALLWPEKSVMGGDKGAFKQAESHMALALHLLEASKWALIVRTLNRWVIPLLVRANFGPRAPLPRIQSTNFTREARAVMANLARDAMHVGHQVEVDGELRYVSIGTLIDPVETLEALAIPRRSIQEAATVERPTPPNQTPASAPDGAPPAEEAA